MRRVVLLLLAVVTAVTVWIGTRERPGEPGRQRGIGFERPTWTTERPSPFVRIRTRRVAGYVTYVPAVTLFILYLFRPKPYVLAWVAAWLVGGSMILMLSFDAQDLRLDLQDEGRQARLVAGRLVVAAWALLSVMFAAFVRWGALWFRSPAAIGREAVWIFAALAAWFVLSAYRIGLIGIIAPMFFLVVALDIRAAWEYLRIARRYRFASALILGLSLACMVGGYFVAAALMAASDGPTPLATMFVYLNGVWAVGMIFGMHMLVFEDVTSELRDSNTALARARDELEAAVITDPLTGCYNRRFFADVSKHELEQHRRHRVPLSLLFIDIDRFKSINDTIGHDAGDRVLRDLGGMLRARTRESDYVFRWGGDEFLILLSADGPAARAKGDELSEVFAGMAASATLSDGVGLSIGCVTVPPDATDLGPLIEQADREMYERKRNGRTGALTPPP